MLPRLKLVNLLIVCTVFVLACQPAPPAPAPAPAKESGAAPAAPAAPAAKQAAPAPAAPAPAAPAAPAKSGAPTRITMATTNILASSDPFTHSDTYLYPIFCEAIGCLVGWDDVKAQPIPMLAESWQPEGSNTWVFNLRKGVKYSDGTPFTSADVAATIQRAREHPQTRQTDRVRLMTNVETPDDHTVRITTQEPTSGLLDRSFTVGLAMVSKEQLDRGDDLGKVMPVSAGPYMVKEWASNQRAVLVKNPNFYGGVTEGPDEVILRVIRESEVRVTALLNNEVQITELPPELLERVSSAPNAKVEQGGTLTIMFVAMNPLFKPWDNKLVRQAVAHAIDRDSIIKNILKGYAEKLEGPLGPGTYGYDPAIPKLRYTYDPAKAKQLMAEAGYADGIDVENVATQGNYIADKAINEAIAAMLTSVGLRMTISTPEQSKRTTDFEAGKLPFYYQQRGSVRDPGGPLAQYMETGATKRLNYSNPRLDDLFKKERATFQDAERKQVLNETVELIQEEVPMHFLWRHKLLWGISRNVEWTPRLDEAFYPSTVRVK